PARHAERRVRDAVPVAVVRVLPHELRHVAPAPDVGEDRRRERQRFGLGARRLRLPAAETDQHVRERRGRVVVGRLRGRPAPSAAAGASLEASGRRVEREEWWLLQGDARIAGTRHLVITREARGAKTGWRFEEHVVLLPASSRLPGARVQTIEETDD